ncbi:MAG: 50S ribosomal protein L18 [Acidobacteria bacterium RIFCSPLOWO2_12_FULL_67_14]|nr:MAG: 50S ribosomal protein L18 [Acidobacteria bacterium RIFCSPLOWO2_02_FULL_67_21]OFW37704.1 MAG: 50S ribosomal protein L18 [Acidobacteria bacterium RIFCSPLOWO2_12_FULL_67_14]
MKIKTKEDRRDRIKYRIRKRVRGTEARPRLTVYRSVAHVYVQVVDDMTGRTIASASSLEPKTSAAFPTQARGGNIAGAQAIGKTIAQRLLEKGVTRVVFDRNGFLYHGRVKAVADAAREAGLEF